MTILSSVWLDYTRPRVLINGVWWDLSRSGISLAYHANGLVIMTLLGARFQVNELVMFTR